MSGSRSVRVAAVDLGASSGRVVLAEVGRDHLTIAEVARFSNGPVTEPDGLHWDLHGLHRSALAGLRAAVDRAGGLASVAVDSWAVDYGLLRDGELLGTPYHYRDERTERGVAAVHGIHDHAALFDRNGLQFLPFNTLYQLAAEAELERADRMLLVPDLLGFWLTGEDATERTNASTTGLLDVRTGEWDLALADHLGIPRLLLGPLVDPGEVVGELLPDVAALVGQQGLQLTTVGSHDTASAVVGVPMLRDDAAYLSCGTWGLVGLELPAPVLSAAAREANFTNERGVDGRIRFLTNVMGTWLLSETLRTWGLDGNALPGLIDQAADAPAPRWLFDVQDPRFVAPGNQPARIAAWYAERDLPAPGDRPTLVRAIVESLAQAYAEALGRAAEIAGHPVRVLHVVGGGSRNALLCQAIANRSGLPVVAGPVEATALGNVVVQARTVGALEGDLDTLRALIDHTHDLRRYEPEGSPLTGASARMGP